MTQIQVPACSCPRVCVISKWISSQRDSNVASFMRICSVAALNLGEEPWLAFPNHLLFNMALAGGG